MIVTEIYASQTSEKQLVITRSTENFKLLQNETGKLYDSGAVDVFAGYDEGGTPKGKFTYTETDIPSETEDDYDPYSE
ncbi:MAG: hypothetical protein IJL87_06765 [Clostridia bacterium]|nr:hypothetical protein [Clostridia bacterium]